MGLYRIKLDNLMGGLNTSRSPVGLPFNWLTMAKNIRYGKRGIQSRPGMKRITGALDCHSYALHLSPCDFGDPSYVRVPLNTEQMKLGTRLTIDFAIRPAATDGQARILGFDTDSTQPFDIRWTSDETIVVRLTDENGNTYSLTTEQSFDISTDDFVIPVRVVRNGSYFAILTTTVVEGVTQTARNDLPADVGLIAPTGDMIIGSLGTSGSTGPSEIDATPFCGWIDDVRIFKSYIPGQQHAFVSWPKPRYHSLVYYARCSPVFNTQETSDLVADPVLIDDSSYANHGSIEGTAEFSSPDDGLVIDMSPVTGIIGFSPAGKERQIVWASGESLFGSPIH